MSIHDNPTELVNVIDSLMNELDQLASLPGTSSNELFDRVGDTLNAICQPEGYAIFVLGPNGVPCNASRNKHSIEAFFPAWQNAVDEIAASDEGYLALETGKLTNLAFGLRKDSSLKGLLVASIDQGGISSVVLSVMKAIAELLTRYISRELDTATTGDFLKRVNEFSLGCMSTLNAKKLAKIIANDSRLLLECERVQLFEKSSGRLILRAVSSVAIFEKRTELLRSSKRVAQMALRQQKPILSTQGTNDKKLQENLDEYCELAGMPFIAFFPLQVTLRNRAPSQSIGILLVENTQQPVFFEFIRAANVVVPQTSLAMTNARQVSSIPFRRALMFLGNNLGLASLSKLALFLILPVALICASLLIQTDFKVRINGTLRAVKERLVFSPHDAFVEKVLVVHGEFVAAGQQLLELRSPDLELELEEAIGEIEKLKKFKITKEIVLNQATTGNPEDRTTQARLASEIADVEFQISANQDKRDHARRRMEELKIFSPIDGKVVTWNVQKLLHKKPVRWGDPLMKIADEQHAWELRFKAPETKIGYIRKASQGDADLMRKLTVEYFFESNPEQKYLTRIRDAADSTEMDPEVGPSVALVCQVDAKQDLKRHGARVVGDVNCGKTSIAYVWTCELFDAIRRQFVW